MWVRVRVRVIKPIKRQHCLTEFIHKGIFIHTRKLCLITDCDIVITDKTDPAEPRTREMYWINRLKTMYPLGLNK